MAGACTTTTTTTTTGPGGYTGTKTDTETQSEESFCKRNPADKQCVDKESSISGSCGAVTCTGDAIQCAMAREQARRNCQMFDDATPLSNIGNAAANGVAQPGDHPGANGSLVAFDLASRLESAPLFGTDGGCPADATVGQWSIPFSRMCDSLHLLGVALKLFAYLVAAFIVFRRSA